MSLIKNSLIFIDSACDCHLGEGPSYQRDITVCVSIIPYIWVSMPLQIAELCMIFMQQYLFDTALVLTNIVCLIGQ